MTPEQRNYWTRSSMSRRRLLRRAALGAAGLAGAALIGCGEEEETPTPAATAAATGTGTSTAPTATATAESQPKQGGILRSSDTHQAAHFSSWHSGNEASLWELWREDFGYFDSLWGLRESEDPDRQVYLRLADSFEQAEPTTFVVKLKEAHFHDQPAHRLNDRVGGRPVDAEDMVAIHEFLKVPPAVGYVAEPRENLTVTAIDERTVKYEWAQPYAFHLEIRQMPTARELLDEQVLKENPPIGTGPFMYKSHRVGTTEEMQRNPNYFMAGRPYLDGKLLTVVPDAAAQEAAFRANELDAMGFSDIRQRDSIARDLGDEIYAVTYPSAGGMAFIMNIRREPFNDVRIREAIHRAMDVQRVIDIVTFGDGKRCWYFADANYTRFPIGFEGVQEWVGHDKQKAAQLVAAAKADGSYSGRELEFIIPAEVQTWMDGMRLISEDLEEVGLKIKLAPTVRNVQMQRVGPKDVDDKSKAADFDLSTSIFLSYAFQKSDTGYPAWQNTSLEDPEVDALVDRIYQATDTSERAELSHEFERMIARKYTPFVPIMTYNNHVGWYSYVKGQDFEDSRSGAYGWQVGIWFDR